MSAPAGIETSAGIPAATDCNVRTGLKLREEQNTVTDAREHPASLDVTADKFGYSG